MELSLLHMKGLFAVAKEGERMHEQTLFNLHLLHAKRDGNKTINSYNPPSEA